MGKGTLRHKAYGVIPRDPEHGRERIYGPPPPLMAPASGREMSGEEIAEMRAVMAGRSMMMPLMPYSKPPENWPSEEGDHWALGSIRAQKQYGRSRREADAVRDVAKIYRADTTRGLAPYEPRQMAAEEVAGLRERWGRSHTTSDSRMYLSAEHGPASYYSSLYYKREVVPPHLLPESGLRRTWET